MKPIILTAAALLICQAAGADTIVLKSGKSIEGSIVREDAENYYIDVNVTKSIKEEKPVAKADVLSIEKDSEDTKAFAAISGLTPTPDLLEEDAYAARIAKIEEFIVAYPDSSFKKPAEKMVEELKGEMEIIAAGGAKIEGLMILPDDYAANAYAFDEEVAAKHIHDAVSRRDFLSALRLFEDYEASFSQAAGRAVVVDKIKQVLAAYGASLSQNLDSFDKRMEMRATGLERMSPEDRAQTQKALDEQHAALEAKFAEEKAAKEMWITPDANLKESLTEALRQVDAQSKKLESGKATPATEKPFEELYREIWSALGSGDADAKKNTLDVARKAKLPDIYLEKLTERAGIPAK